MQIHVEIPSDVAEELRQAWGDLDRAALEAIVVQAYRDEVLTSAQVGRVLGLESRAAVAAFLKERRAYLHYDSEDLESDLATLRTLRS